MKALVLNKFGDPPALEYTDVQVAKPARDEVLIKVAVAPINPSDLILLGGRNPFPRQLPLIPGFEGSGTVIESGGGAIADQLVTRNVACRAISDGNGTWAEYVVTKAERCIPLEPAVSLQQGAMMLVNPLTAWAFMHRVRETGHKAAIQTAAASALGQMIIKLATKSNLPLINVVRSQKQADDLRRLGAEHILNSSKDDFPGQLRQLAQSLNATVAFDAVAGDLCNVILAALPNGSELWSYGGLSNEPCKIDPMVLIYQNKAVKGFWGPPIVYALNKPDFDAAISYIQKNLDKIFHTTVRAVYQPTEHKQALADYMSTMGSGKVLFSWHEQN
jgi:NADPH:quinone reductase-like Zn-dependent oxidoreductase